jgi:hypothetical protein
MITQTDLWCFSLLRLTRAAESYTSAMNGNPGLAVVTEKFEELKAAASDYAEHAKLRIETAR